MDELYHKLASWQNTTRRINFNLSNNKHKHKLRRHFPRNRSLAQLPLHLYWPLLSTQYCTQLSERHPIYTVNILSHSISLSQNSQSFLAITRSSSSASEHTSFSFLCTSCLFASVTAQHNYGYLAVTDRRLRLANNIHKHNISINENTSLVLIYPPLSSFSSLTYNSNICLWTHPLPHLFTTPYCQLGYLTSS